MARLDYADGLPAVDVLTTGHNRAHRLEARQHSARVLERQHLPIDDGSGEVHDARLRGDDDHARHRRHVDTAVPRRPDRAGCFIRCDDPVGWGRRPRPAPCDRSTGILRDDRGDSRSGSRDRSDGGKLRGQAESDGEQERCEKAENHAPNARVGASASAGVGSFCAQRFVHVACGEAAVTSRCFLNNLVGLAAPGWIDGLESREQCPTRHPPLRPEKRRSSRGG